MKKQKNRKRPLTYKKHVHSIKKGCLSLAAFCNLIILSLLLKVRGCLPAFGQSFYYTDLFLL